MKQLLKKLELVAKDAGSGTSHGITSSPHFLPISLPIHQFPQETKGSELLRACIFRRRSGLRSLDESVYASLFVLTSSPVVTTASSSPESSDS